MDNTATTDAFLQTSNAQQAIVHSYSLNEQGVGLIPIDDIQKDSVMVNFGLSTGNKSVDHLELHIYNPVGDLLDSSYSIPYTVVAGISNSEEPLLNNIKLNIHQIFRDMGYVSGKFNFNLNFHRNVLGSNDKPAIITGVTFDRLELTISLNGQSNFEGSPLIDDFGNRLEYYVNAGNNNLYRIARFSKNIQLSTPNTNVYNVILQSPLDAEIGIGKKLWVDLQVADTQEDSIVIFPKNIKDDLNALRGPNFSITTNIGFAQSTAFKSWDDILGSNPTSSQQLINKFISSSFGGIELPTDYREYSNFVFYSSAEERLRNFEYKVKLIEYYDGLILSSNNVANPAVAVNRTDLNSKRNTIIAGFDGYEKYLYYESSSYETSSYGEYNPSTWPKSTSTLPYQLYSYTSSQADTWIVSQKVSASLFDRENDNALVKLIPEHIINDGFNDGYLAFVNMIGQHFDILWSYVTQLSSISSRKESLSEGLAKDLIYHVLTSLGLDAINGFSIEELWLDALAINSSGSYSQTGSLHSISNSDISKETWKRILNNLPYLLKTKGTRRGIRALINCYGVPATVYRIKEYSGPYQYSSTVTALDNQYRKVEKFTLATYFTGSNKVSAAMSSIDSLQFRFKPIYNTSTQSLLSGPVAVLLYPSASSTDTGYIKVGSNTPVKGPFYNGNWNSVTLTDTDAYIFQVDVGRVSGYSGSGTSLTNGTYVLGSGSANWYSGSMQEFRAWNSILPLQVIKEHARNPQSIIGTNTVNVAPELYNYTSSFAELKYRFPLGSTLQTFTGSSVTIASIHPDQSTATTATALNFTSASFIENQEDYYVWYPNLGDGLDIADKIRIESASLDGQLSNQHSVEVSQYDTFGFDSPKVGVFFSPQDEINEDIASQFSGLHMDQFIGDPRDDYKENYPQLESLRSHYNKVFTNRNNFSSYIKLVENFDASMFYMIKKFLPARTTKMVGLVIQPTLLERSKIRQRTVEHESESYETDLSILPVNILGEYDTLFAEPILISNVLSGDYLLLPADAELMNSIEVTGDVNYHTGTISPQTGTLSSNIEYVNDNTATRFYPAGKLNHSFRGCKISGRGVNIPSDDTFDNSPVIEVWDTNPNTPLNLGSRTGNISTLPTTNVRIPKDGRNSSGNPGSSTK